MPQEYALGAPGPVCCSQKFLSSCCSFPVHSEFCFVCACEKVECPEVGLSSPMDRTWPMADRWWAVSTLTALQLLEVNSSVGPHCPQGFPVILNQFWSLCHVVWSQHSCLAVFFSLTRFPNYWLLLKNILLNFLSQSSLKRKLILRLSEKLKYLTRIIGN